MCGEAWGDGITKGSRVRSSQAGLALGIDRMVGTCNHHHGFVVEGFGFEVGHCVARFEKSDDQIKFSEPRPWQESRKTAFLECHRCLRGILLEQFDRLGERREVVDAAPPPLEGPARKGGLEGNGRFEGTERLLVLLGAYNSCRCQRTKQPRTEVDRLRAGWAYDN